MVKVAQGTSSLGGDFGGGLVEDINANRGVILAYRHNRN